MRVITALAFLIFCVAVACSSGGTSNSPPPLASSATADALHNGKPTTPAAIQSALVAKGFTVSDARPHEWAYGPAGTSTTVRVDGIQAYLNAFPSIKDTKEWTVLSEAFDGIAAVGDTWSVSMDSHGVTATPAQAKVMAGRIAKALDAELKAD